MYLITKYKNRILTIRILCTLYLFIDNHSFILFTKIIKLNNLFEKQNIV